MVYMFFSTSKMTFPGAGISAIASSEENIQYLRRNIGISRICYDKLNQLRHVRFLKNLDNIKAIMKKHANYIKPKFDIAFRILEENFGKGNDFIRWTHPKGGYFFSIYLKNILASKVIKECKERGVIFTDAGAAYPYGMDIEDSHIRFAPTYANIEGIEIATRILCEVVKSEFI